MIKQITQDDINKLINDVTMGLMSGIGISISVKEKSKITNAIIRDVAPLETMYIHLLGMMNEILEAENEELKERILELENYTRGLD